MKIVSVSLENFRIHKKLTVDFDKGINLLIGRNGAGKSSVLEAIGFALFNSDLRVKGNKLAVRHGAKSAGITVQFIGNDENEYRVERKIGSVTRWQLFYGDEKSPRYQGNEELVPRLRELVGVKKNEKRLFSDVICAVQNRFVDIFAGTPVQRETTFNLLFDTEVYRDLYKHFTGDESVERSYQYQQERLSGELSALEEIRIDTTAVKEEKMAHEKALLLVQEKQKKQNEQLVTLNAKKSSNEQSQRLLSELELEREHLSKELISKQNHYQESEVHVTRAKEAKDLITEHETSFKRYEELAIERAKHEEKLKYETAVRKNVEIKQNRLSQIELELERCESENRSISQTDETIQQQFLERTSELKKLVQEIEGLQLRSEDIVVRGKRASEPMNRYNVELLQYNEIEKEKELLQNSVNQFHQQEAELAILPSEKEHLLQTLLQLTTKESELKRYQEQKKEREIELRELKRAAKELADGFCPLLKEQCNNLNEQNNATTYFDKRETDLAVKIAMLENSIQPLVVVPQEINDVTRQQAVVEEKFRQLEQLEYKLKQSEEKLRYNQELQAVILEKMCLIEPDENIDSFPEFEKRHQILEKLREQIGVEYKLVQEQIVPLQEKSEALGMNLQKLEYERAGLESKKQAISSQKELLINENKVLTEELRADKKDLSQYDSVRAELENVKQAQAVHENGYRIYLEKRELATTLRSAEEAVLFLKSELAKLTDNSSTVAEKISKYDKKTLQKELEELLNKEKTIQETIALHAEQAILKIESIKQCEDSLEQAKKQGDKIIRLLSEKNTIAKKLEITKLFRSNLKEMGRFVASGIVEDIAVGATGHFHRITGRGERIEWVVNDSEKYTVYLVSGEEGQFRREFSVLSGGEQVAVALSLRAAMAHELASGDFAIFDEPTVNLDTERRTALAESLKSMLGTMEQTIIVTHDDVFREMAQKTIEL